MSDAVGAAMLGYEIATAYHQRQLAGVADGWCADCHRLALHVIARAWHAESAAVQAERIALVIANAATQDQGRVNADE